MAKPRVFVSSTFYDLKHVRNTLEAFIRTLGYEPVLSEKGSIAYSPEIALDESCYREAKACDIFVLIIGGRYGSEASSEDGSTDKGFYERYDSITRKEYESAIDRDIPTYVLIEKSVQVEYETFKRNRENVSIKYAHVDSVNVFNLIDYVLSRPRNNPVYHFEMSTEIEAWLRNQWAGLFKELIRTQADKKQIASLADQVADLSNVGTTLKRYLEEVVARVGGREQAKEIIDEEKSRLSQTRELNELAKLNAVETLTRIYDIPIEVARDTFAAAKTLDDLAKRVENLTKGQLPAEQTIEFWGKDSKAASSMNEVRTALHLPLLSFADEDRKVAVARRPRKREQKQPEIQKDGTANLN